MNFYINTVPEFNYAYFKYNFKDFLMKEEAAKAKVPCTRVSIAAQRVKPQLVIPASHIGVPVQVMAVLLLIQLHDFCTCEESRSWPGTWVPITHVGVSFQVPGSDLA